MKEGTTSQLNENVEGSMNRFSRKLISVLTMLAFVLQLFSPAISFAQSAQTQKAQIEKATAEFQKTYDAIMAVKPVELGGMANFTINAIDGIKSVASDVGGFFKGESAAEREARKKQEEYNKYKAQIDRANKDIEQLKADAKATMAMLKSGDIQSAANTDPTKSYNSIVESGGALGVYQKALGDAGKKLLDIAGKLSTAGTVIGIVTAILIPIAVVFPAVAPAVPVMKGVTLALTIAEGVIKAAGNTLVTASEKAITGDQDFMKTIALETTLQAADTATGIVLGKTGVGVAGSALANTAVGGLTGSIREVNRSGATGAEAGKIISREFVNAGVSSTVGAVFEVGIGKVAQGMTADILSSSPKLDAKFTTDQSREGVTGLIEKGLSQGLDPVQSAVTDGLSIQEPEEPERPKANEQPSLGGSW